MIDRNSATPLQSWSLKYYKPTPPRQRLLNERQRFPARGAMLAAQIIDSADEAAPTTAVMITAACPVCAVGKF
jgi:hypothetical protein